MGTQADPETLSAMASRLRNASTEAEGQAGEPPMPQAGAVTPAIEAALRTICEGMANMSASVGAVGDSVGEGRDLYTETDYQAALGLERTQANAEQPN